MKTAVRQILFGKKRNPFSPVDPFFSNVVLYLKGEGSTIVDSSETPKAITTLSGNPVISQAQSKFGASSIYFDGASSLSVNITSTPINIRTDSWTFETFQYITTGLEWTAFSSSNDFYIVKVAGDVYVGDGTINPIALPWVNNFNTWEHLAVSFDGVTYRLFRNGILAQSTSILLANKAINAIGTGVFNGAYFTNGYYDNMRVTKGVCRYVNNFNPDTDTFMG